MAKKELTDNQKAFLEHLFGEAKGHPVEAKKLAGYSDGTPTTTIMNALREEIVSRTTDYLAMYGPKAAMSMTDMITGVTPASKDDLAVSKEILDRGGIVKPEKLEIVAKGGVIIMPALEEDVDPDEV